MRCSQREGEVEPVIQNAPKGAFFYAWRQRTERHISSSHPDSIAAMRVSARLLRSTPDQLR
jgi:hypothetical protein